MKYLQYRFVHFLHQDIKMAKGLIMKPNLQAC